MTGKSNIALRTFQPLLVADHDPAVAAQKSQPTGIFELDGLELDVINTTGGE